MHKLLQRRIAKLLSGGVPRELEAFVRAVSEDYAQADVDRELLERSLELSSKELLAANAELRDDVRHQHVARVAAMNQEVEFRELIRVLPVAVVVRRGDRVVLANDAFLNAVGRTSATVQGASYISLVHPEEQALARARIDHFERTHEPDPNGQTRWIGAGGQTVYLELELAREVTLDSAPALLLALRDVTELKNMHARLAVADRMASVGTMAAGVAHEINNPLSFILSNIDYVVNELADGPQKVNAEVTTALDEARIGAERVKEIVRDLKSFSRVGEGDPVACDVQEVVEGAIKLAWNEIRHVGRLERVFSKVRAVRANPGRLGQVFLNLLINAAQSLPPNTAQQNVIHVSIEERGGQVVVQVRDTGVGMSDDQIGRIFDPFFTTKSVGVGTGLGLSICHGIVTQLGGRIEVESRKHEGSCFRVWLPAVYSAALTPAPRLVAPAANQALRIMIIDDDELVGRGLTRSLHARHEVEYFSSPLKALMRLHDVGQRFDAVLCDLMMPELDGESVYEAVRHEAPELLPRFVFMTGGAFLARARAFLDRTGVKRLEKPFTAATVEEMLRTLPPKLPPQERAPNKA